MASAVDDEGAAAKKSLAGAEPERTKGGGGEKRAWPGEAILDRVESGRPE